MSVPAQNLVNPRYSARDIIRLFSDPKNANAATQNKLKNICYKAAQKNMQQYDSSNDAKFLRKAYTFYAIAALAGHAISQYIMAEAYRTGIEKTNIKMNYSSAKYFYQAAAIQKHPIAQCRLAYLYLDLSYAQKDLYVSPHSANEAREKGIFWLKEALGSVEAQKKIQALDAEKNPKMSCVIL